jgi:DNA-binding response OmpR family regulator
MPNILIIEDTYDMQMLLNANLTARGYDVVIAPDGESGLKLAGEKSPDLVILDIRLPGISGWEVLNNLQSRFSSLKIPVIIITASEAKDAELEAFAKGAAGYLAKPFELHKLLALVEHLIKKAA